MTNSKLHIGTIRGAHGVRGLARIAVHAEDTSLFSTLTDYKITLKNKHKHDVWLAHIDGITNKEDADALKGIKLYCSRDDLTDINDDEIYHADLIGMKCVDENGKDIGIILSVDNFGAGDLLNIKPTTGDQFYLSYDGDTVLKVDKEIIVRIPDIV